MSIKESAIKVLNQYKEQKRFYKNALYELRHSNEDKTSGAYIRKKYDYNEEFWKACKGCDEMKRFIDLLK